MQMIMIAGNIGKDSELRKTQNGDEVAGFSVAVDNGKDREGNRRDSTWYDCSIWGKRAAALSPYLKKGGKVTVTGRPTVRVHEGKAYLGVSVDQITLQGGKSDGPDRSGGYDQSPPQDQGVYSGGDLGGDTIPFAPVVLI